MKCPKCGTENENDAVFCKKCGEAIYEYWDWDDAVDESSPQEQTTETEEKDVPEPEEITETSETAEDKSALEDETLVSFKLDAPIGEIDTGEAETQSIPPEEDIFEESEKKKSFVPLVILESLILIGLLAGGYKMETARCAPRNVAENFFKAELNSDFGEAYALTDFKGKEMLSGAYYADACALTEKKQGGQNLKIQKTGKGETYTATYKDLKNKKTYSETVTLKKTGEKRLGLFDTWKVAGGDMIAKNISFSVPKGSHVFLCGKEVPEAFIYAEDKSEMEEVILPEMFTGSWQLRIEKDGMETFRKIVEVSDSGMAPDSFVLKPDRKLGEEVRTSAAAAVEALVRYTYDKDGSVEGLFADDAAAKKGIARMDTIVRGGLNGELISVSTSHLKVETRDQARVVYLTGTLNRSTLSSGRFSETGEKISFKMTYTGEADNLKIASIE